MSEHSNTFKTITTEEVNDFIKEKNITILDIRDEESKQSKRCSTFLQFGI